MNKYMKRLVAVSVTVCAVLVGCRDRAAANKTEQIVKKSDNVKADVETVTMTLSDGSEVTWLKDNPAHKFNPRELFPDASDDLWNSLNMPDGLPATISTFLLKVGDDYILFDTGLGEIGGQMHRHLTDMGIKASDVRLVYLTHLHADHIGGLIGTGENGSTRVMFPNADIYVSKTEYNAWMTSISNNELQKRIMDIYKDKLHLFEFDDILPCYVQAIDAVGHTPGHTAFRYQELLVVGDIIHGYELQKDYPQINSIYDMDKDKAAESRRRLLALAEEQRLLMAGMHLPENGFVKHN